MKRCSAAAPADERGFILVGVVMFMIALTILGLSLFALSSYEAQFFYASQSREQALQSSESGMEVVKSLLSDPSVPSAYRYRLEAAQLAVGHFGITRALAYQARNGDPNDTTSRGPINWDSPLVIVVSGRAGSEERSVQSKFIALPRKSPYEQLITAGQGIWYNTNGGDPPQLSGGVWQPVTAAGDTAWTGFVNWIDGRPVDPTPPAIPAANAFVDAHLASATEPTSDNIGFSDPTDYWVNFEGAPQGSSFYKLPPNSSPTSGQDDPEFRDYGFYCDHRLLIRIHGRVVWLLNGGVCFGNTVTVIPDPDRTPDADDPDVLVIVAKPSGAGPSRGIWFKRGLVNDSLATRVFLVSDGDIAYTQEHYNTTRPDAQALSIVAGGNVELMGPSSGTPFKVSHPASMNGFADDLVTDRLLPMPNGGSGMKFAFTPHSWLETRLP